MFDIDTAWVFTLKEKFVTIFYHPKQTTSLYSWLLRDREMLLRTTYPGFIAAVNEYFDKLIPKVVPFQVGFFLKHKKYSKTYSK